MTIRVLLADDHAVLREGLRSLLTASPGISVIADVANGREAIRSADELKPDVLVMDIAMPDVNGIEASHIIRARRSTSTAPSRRVRPDTCSRSRRLRN